MSYPGKNVIKDGTAQTLGETVTDQAVTGSGETDSFGIHPINLRAIVIDLDCSAVTAGAGITAKLQVRYAKGQAWLDSKTVAITGNGTFSIRLLDTVAGDQPFLPLKPQARVVVTTGAGSAVTVDKVHVPAGY